jgi:uncharacterized FlaG/YvyC family protein
MKKFTIRGSYPRKGELVIRLADAKNGRTILKITPEEALELQDLLNRALEDIIPDVK